MATRFLYVEVDESTENTYVNIFEVFQQYYLSYFNKIYTNNLEHSDIVELAEKDSYSHFLKIAPKLQRFKCDTTLIHGPNECLIELVQASISIGHNYQIELVLVDKFNDEVLGSLDLNEYVIVINPEIGEAELKVENNKYLLCSSILLLRQSILCLRVSGSVRINSSIKLIAHLNGDL